MGPKMFSPCESSVCFSAPSCASALVRLDAFSSPKIVFCSLLFHRLPVWLQRSLFIECVVEPIRGLVGVP